MTRKLIAGGLVVAALIAGLVGVSASVIAADHSARVPFDRPATVVKTKPTADADTLDLNNWNETRDVMVNSGSRR